MKKITKKKSKDKAWKAFSLYIRTKYADKDGMVKCYTCGNTMHWKKAQAGHGLGGRYNAVLFMEEFVRVQDVGCNMYAGGRYAVFTKKLIEEYGSERYFELVREANQSIQYTIEDYLAIAEKYNRLLKELNYEN